MIFILQDSNRDGVFTVQELIDWIDEHKLIKFAEEGRDADMDRIFEKPSASENSGKEQSPDSNAPSEEVKSESTKSQSSHA